MSISNDLKTVFVALNGSLKLECPVCGTPYSATVSVSGGEYHVTITKRGNTWQYSAHKAAEILEVIAQSVEDHTTCGLHPIDQIAHLIKSGETEWVQAVKRTSTGFVITPKGDRKWKVGINRSATATVVITDKRGAPVQSVHAPEFIAAITA